MISIVMNLRRFYEANDFANLKANEIGLAIQPMSQSLQEFPEMAAHHRRIHQEVAAPAGHTLQTLSRLGHAEPVPPTPRRAPRDLAAS